MDNFEARLWDACKDGNVEQVLFALKQGANVTTMLRDFDDYGHEFTPLEIAAKHGNLEVIRVLLNNHASVTSYAQCIAPRSIRTLFERRDNPRDLNLLVQCNEVNYQLCLRVGSVEELMSGIKKHCKIISGFHIEVQSELFEENCVVESLEDIPADKCKLKVVAEDHLEDIRVISELGNGNYGFVYKGLWRETTHVAIKIPVVSLVHREVKFFKSLNHPNVARYLGLCVVPQSNGDQDLAIVLEILSGSLRQFLREKTGKLTQEELVKIAMNVAAGMDYLHSQKIVHRDLHSGNLLVDSHSLTVKITDFGLSATINSCISPLGAVGFATKWTAPEALTDGQFSYMSDVWSFGVCCYEIFTFGQDPFSNLKGLDSVKAVVISGKIEEFLSKSSTIPDTIYDLMSQCWNQDPNRRPSFLKIHKMLSENLAEISQVDSIYKEEPLSC